MSGKCQGNQSQSFSGDPVFFTLDSDNLSKICTGIELLVMTIITLLTQLFLREFVPNFGSPGVLKIFDVSNSKRTH